MERKNPCACGRCGRALKDPESLRIGLGPICRGKAARGSGDLFNDQPVLMDVGTLEEVGLIVQRMGDGRVAANVPHVVKWHSPSGFEIAYAGSGPAELALNVLHQLLPHRGAGDAALIGGVLVSRDAERLHQAFKFDFIATMDKDGGRIPIETINEWLAQRLMREAA